MGNFFLGLFLIFTGGIVSCIAGARVKGAFFAVFSVTGAILILKTAVCVILSAQLVENFFLMPYPIGEIRISWDSLSAFFVILISLGTIFSSVYAAGYLKPYATGKDNLSSHYFLFSILIISMFLVVSVRNALAFLVVWEIMSVSSFFLVVFDYEKHDTVMAGLKYLISMHIGLIFILMGFLILSVKSANLDFGSFMNIGLSRKWIDLIFALFFIGFGTKAGFVPFHTWLPHAHPAAPSHVSAVMSGIMIKTGIYAILRTITFFPNLPAEIPYFFIFISALTCLWGIINATMQKETKKLLAYSSIENIGIIGLGIGFGMLGRLESTPQMLLLGYSGALAHTLNHSFFKPLLFFCAGSVYRQTHTLNMEKLGGLIKCMPVNSILFLAGSVSICAFPLFNGFISELMIYLSAFAAMNVKSPAPFAVAILSICAIAFTGAIALICFSKIFGIMFLGAPRQNFEHSITDNSKSMLYPQTVLAILCLITGTIPQLLLFIVQPAVSVFLSDNPYADFSDFYRFAVKISLCFFGFAILTGIIFLIRFMFLRNKKYAQCRTWNCGYQLYSPRVQYSGSSYSNPFLNIIKPLIWICEKHYYPRGLFPKKGSVQSDCRDLAESYLIYPFIHGVRKILNIFSWIQSGNTQQYILYGLIFLVLALIWVLW